MTARIALALTGSFGLGAVLGEPLLRFAIWCGVVLLVSAGVL